MPKLKRLILIMKARVEKIHDKIYGSWKIEEPVIRDLLKSNAIKRLKNISQFGVPDRYYFMKNYSRYEHSIGVMLLLRKLGASLDEQIAGLLHDISHLAFSHVADWVFSNGEKGMEELQNNLMGEFILNGNISKILKKYGYDPMIFLDENKFLLLEKKIPDLCADRLDYSLREFYYWLDRKSVSGCIKAITIYKNEIVFSDKEQALIFATNFLKLQTKHWGGFEAVKRYYLFSKALKIAINIGFLSRKDFYKNESYIVNKLEKSKNKEIAEILSVLKKKKIKRRFLYGEKVFKKFRYVDPKVIVKNKAVPLSRLNPKFRKILEENRKINKKGIQV